jgi:hypothetical protein
VKQTWTTRDFRLQAATPCPSSRSPTKAMESRRGRPQRGPRHPRPPQPARRRQRHRPTRRPRLVGGLVGPGKAIDTSRHWVIASNMLGCPTAHRPGQSQSQDRSRPARVRHHPARHRDGAELDGLGVTHLVAVRPVVRRFWRPWRAVTYPDAMDGVVAVVTAPERPRRSGGGRHAPGSPGGRSGVERRLALRSRRDCRDDDGPARRDAPELRHPGGPGAHDRGSRRARRRAPPPGRGVGPRVRSQLAARAAQGVGHLRRRARLREDPRPGALRAVAHGQALPPSLAPSSWPSSPGPASGRRTSRSTRSSAT